MQEFPPESIDMVITSPPYNVDVKYGKEVNDNLDYGQYLNWLDAVWESCFRVLVDGGRICINVADLGRNPYFSIHSDITVRLRNSGWYLMGIIIWNKQQMSSTAWGSWESASAPSLRGSHEFIIVAGKNKKKKSPRLPGAKSGPFLNCPEKKEFLSLTHEIWKILPETNSKHPAPFPYELPSRLIRLFSFEGDVILDPFCGSGTTLRAAKDFHREYIGIDAVEKWVKMSKERVAQEIMF